MTTPICWTAETRALVLPRRSHGVRELMPAAARAGELIGKVFGLRRAALLAGTSHPAAAEVVLHRAALAALEDIRSATVEAAAASAALLLFELDPQSEPNLESMSVAFIDHWLETRGAAFAVEACATTALLGARKSAVHPEASTVLAGLPVPSRVLLLMRYSAMQLGDGPHEDVERRWKALRRRLATIPDPAYAEARGAAERVLSATPPLRLALRIAYAFPDEKAWIDQVARDVLESTTARSLHRLVLRSLADRRLVDELVEKTAEGAGELAPAAFGLIDALGFEAEEALMKIAEMSFRRSWGAEEETHTVLTALAMLPTPTVLCWFLERFERKIVQPHANALMRRSPRDALAILARAVTTKNASARQSSLLAAIVRTSIDDARVVLAETLAADGRESSPAKLLTGLIEENEITSEAEPSTLPATLVAPPWRQKKAGAKKAKPLVLPLQALPFDEAISWTGLEHPALPNEPTTSNNSTEAKLRAGERLYFWELNYLPKARALEVLIGSTPNTFYEYHWGGELTVQLARFGLHALDPLLAISTGRPNESALQLEAVVSPRIAPLMAHAFARVRKARRVAERWLIRNPRAAAIGLVVTRFGVGVEARDRDSATKALRFMASRRHRPLPSRPHDAGATAEARRAPERAALSVTTSVSRSSGRVMTWWRLRSRRRTRRGAPLCGRWRGSRP